MLQQDAYTASGSAGLHVWRFAAAGSSHTGRLEEPELLGHVSERSFAAVRRCTFSASGDFLFCMSKLTGPILVDVNRGCKHVLLEEFIPNEVCTLAVHFPCANSANLWRSDSSVNLCRSFVSYDACLHVFRTVFAAVPPHSLIRYTSAGAKCISEATPICSLQTVLLPSCA